jgi:hypothetical protein
MSVSVSVSYVNFVCHITTEEKLHVMSVKNINGKFLRTATSIRGASTSAVGVSQTGVIATIR